MLRRFKAENLSKSDDHLAKLIARKLTYHDEGCVTQRHDNAGEIHGKMLFSRGVIMNNDMYQIEDTSYKLKEAEGLIGLLQDELAAVKRAHSEVAEEAK